MKKMMFIFVLGIVLGLVLAPTVIAQAGEASVFNGAMPPIYVISSGSITPLGENYIRVTPAESGPGLPADNNLITIDTVNYTEGSRLILRTAYGDQDITIRHNWYAFGGNLMLKGSADRTMTGVYQTIEFILVGTKWVEIGR